MALTAQNACAVHMNQAQLMAVLQSSMFFCESQASSAGIKPHALRQGGMFTHKLKAFLCAFPGMASSRSRQSGCRHTSPYPLIGRHIRMTPCAASRPHALPPAIGTSSGDRSNQKGTLAPTLKVVHHTGWELRNSCGHETGDRDISCEC